MRRYARLLTTLTIGTALTLTAGSISAAAASPGSGPAAPTAKAPKSVVLVPAFDNDLPKGSGSFSASASASASSRSSASTAVAPLAAAAAWVCSVYTSDPWLDGVFITGDGTQTCTGVGYAPMKVNVTIQSYGALGFWNNRTAASGSWTAVTMETLQPYYDCSGDGTYTYRLVSDGYAQSGLYHQAVQSLNYLRVTC